MPQNPGWISIRKSICTLFRCWFLKVTQSQAIAQELVSTVIKKQSPKFRKKTLTIKLHSSTALLHTQVRELWKLQQLAESTVSWKRERACGTTLVMMDSLSYFPCIQFLQQFFPFEQKTRWNQSLTHLEHPFINKTILVTCHN